VSTKNQTRFGFQGGLLIAAAIALWLLAAPIFAASTSVMNRPMIGIQADLGKLLHCQWQGADVYAVCSTKQIDGTVDLSRDPADKSVETVEMIALVAGYPKPRPDAEKLNRDTVLRVVAYLLPTWKNAPGWLTGALHAAAHGRARKVIKIGDLTVLVQQQQFADVDETFATIVITKKASLDAWKQGNDD